MKTKKQHHGRDKAIPNSEGKRSTPDTSHFVQGQEIQDAYDKGFSDGQKAKEEEIKVKFKGVSGYFYDKGQKAKEEEIFLNKTNTYQQGQNDMLDKCLNELPRLVFSGSGIYLPQVQLINEWLEKLRGKDGK